jgi:hypothetical protein
MKSDLLRLTDFQRVSLTSITSATTAFDGDAAVEQWHVLARSLQ